MIKKKTNGWFEAAGARDTSTWKPLGETIWKPLLGKGKHIKTLKRLKTTKTF